MVTLTDAIHVQPGATCLDVAGLAGEVGTWLASDRVEDDVSVRVEGSPDDERVAWFEVDRGAQVLARRRFDPGPAKCEHLEAMMGLAIALALKVSLVDELTEHQAPPVAPSPEWTLGAEAMGAAGVVPGLGAGLWGYLEAAVPPNLVVRAGVVGLAGGSGTFDRVSGEFSAEIAAVRADACVRQPRSAGATVRLGACVGIVGGGLFLEGRGFASSHDAAVPWGAFATALEATIALGARWSIASAIALVLPLGHPTAGAVSSTGGVVDSRDLGTTGVALSVGPAYAF